MKLQNRVAPDGSLHRHPARGLFTGNRGIIHDPDTKTLLGRRWTHHAWIVCSCSYKGRHRDVWGRNYRNRQGKMAAGWTELFFLDEVTALAAGHRPCFECRREAAKSYGQAYSRGNGIERASAEEMNRALHSQRRLSASIPAPRVSAGEIGNLPDGAMIEASGVFFAIKDGKTLRWDFDGYEPMAALPAQDGFPFTLVTPTVTVAALCAGYMPVWHESAAATAA